MTSSPIIIITGANSGVGFGICQRLLVQLSQRSPTDAQPRFGEGRNEFEACEGVTLIMACRSVERAKEARGRLLHFFDSHVKGQARKLNYDGHAESFQKNVNVEIERLDLASVQSVFNFCNAVSKKYPYISHLICNAGLASYIGINWFEAISQICRSPMSSVTSPEYNYQRQGELSVDALGYVWQCNVFGHYVLYRSLQSLLQASKSQLGSRVIWMSSLEATPKFYSYDDWQLIRTDHSYEASKYQIDMIATVLDRLAREGQGGPTRHLIVEPGVSSTNVANALVNNITNIFKIISFYLARFFGSPHHTISPFISAIAAVHIALVSMASIPTFTLFSHPSTESNGTTQDKPGVRPVRFGSETDWWGEARVGVSDVKMWQEHEQHADELLKRFEGLYQDFRKAEEQARADSE
jgi:3-keto steroid reductase